MQWLSATVLAVAMVSIARGPSAAVEARALRSPCDEPHTELCLLALNKFLAEMYAADQAEQPQAEFHAPSRDYQFLDSGVKRQDVVHNFLRFGRRR